MDVETFLKKIENFCDRCSSCKFKKETRGRFFCGNEKSPFYNLEISNDTPKCDEWRYFA